MVGECYLESSAAGRDHRFHLMMFKAVILSCIIMILLATLEDYCQIEMNFRRELHFQVHIKAVF